METEDKNKYYNDEDEINFEKLNEDGTEVRFIIEKTSE
jgi:hypothetical protein